MNVDLVVVGAGAAGLYATLCAAREGATVALLSATPLAQTASYWAQGGLAAALAADDSPELHLRDTERAGRGAVRRSAAEVLVREAPECVRDLEGLGFRFDADRLGRLALGLEGGHSVRRIVHAGGSATGRRLLRELSALVVEQERVQVIEGARMCGLWLHEGRCLGVVCRSIGASPLRVSPSAASQVSPSAAPQASPSAASSSPAFPSASTPPAPVDQDGGRAIRARATILSTGGAAALWSRTTNPPGSVGEGLLMAYAAGAPLADLELMQFHPTAVIGVRGREGFLVTEAIRGEGATLHDANGERFVDELAPRDEVSRAIQARLRQTGERSVSLDMRAIDPALFPNVVGSLREAGLDPTKELVPVAPAAHYTIGGIVTDLDGRSAVPGLYAVGETACTGLHGANRLASNSLSECFVFGRRAARAALHEPAPPAAGGSQAPPEAPPTLPRVQRATREALWEHAGIERSAEGLAKLLEDEHPLARMIARSALAREESRGVHTRSDRPEREPKLDGRHVTIAPAVGATPAGTPSRVQVAEQPTWEAWE